MTDVRASSHPRSRAGRRPLRLAEAAAEAALILALVLAPAGRYVLDGQLLAILTGMLATLTVAGYAFHAVTFDCFRFTTDRVARPVTSPVPRPVACPVASPVARPVASPVASPVGRHSEPVIAMSPPALGAKERRRRA